MLTIAYNAGRDMFNKKWEKNCPYVANSPPAKAWWKGWYDAERAEKIAITAT